MLPLYKTCQKAVKLHFCLAICLVLFVFGWPAISHAQKPTFNFHHLNTSNGLSDGVIRGIAKDKYGYTWIATQNGLNRYDGYRVTSFYHRLEDSFSLAKNDITGLLCDQNGTLWILHGKGLYHFDYNTTHFVLQPGTAELVITKMLDNGNREIYLATTNGLLVFNTLRGTLKPLPLASSLHSGILMHKYINDFYIYQHREIYIASDTGLIIYDSRTHLARVVPLLPAKGAAIEKVAVDGQGNVWASYGNNGSDLLQTDKDFSSYRLYNEFHFLQKSFRDTRINGIYVDNDNRVWILTANQGISLYNRPGDNFFEYRNDPLQAMSISNNSATRFLQDRDGFIWLGTEGYGINYFHPKKNFFDLIMPSYNQSPTLPDDWCRTVTEDKNGHLWLGTAGGLADYDIKRNTYKIFRNAADHPDVLHYNSIRSLLTDDDCLWIGTANGLNRYHLGTGKMDFFADKDSLPLSFFWSLLKDYKNNIWIGCRDGLFRFNRLTGKFFSLRSDPLLGPYARFNVRTMFEDSRKRIWLGFYYRGVLMYDPVNQRTRYWYKTNDHDSSLSDNGINSITEDNDGKIWIATTQGLNSVEPASGKLKHFMENPTLASEMTASLGTDNKNRLWMSAGKGLYMLDATRSTVKSFDAQDGLPSIDFNNQSAYKTADGHFIFATLKGFIKFKPEDYIARKDTIPVYLSSFRIFNEAIKTKENVEDISRLELSPSQNFFSLEMTALNYSNPSQTWYAHKLDPLDKDWIYTRERQVNYTNVPGGNYIFVYKATTDPSNWDVPEKKLLLHIKTVFYKTVLFWLLVAALLAGLLYWMYRYRMDQQKQILILGTKAERLEKEKTMVQYESLRQHLNPHFLFNSLTSLRSLIRTDTKTATGFLDGLSRVYRYVLKSSENELVQLRDELSFVRTFAELQKIRFKNGLQVHINVTAAAQDKYIVPVTLQSLVENAIKHNTADEESPLLIDIFDEGDFLVVRNTLQRYRMVEASNKYGLASMQSLYKYFTATPIEIIEGGPHFIIRIPLL